MLKPKIHNKPWVLVCFLLLLITGCKETMFGNKTIEEEFTDPRDASMVRAAVENDLDVLQQIIQKGADVNSVGSQGITPLLWVLAVNKFSAVEVLLQPVLPATNV